MSFSNFYFVERADVDKAERVYKICKQIKKDIKNYSINKLKRFRGDKGDDKFLFIFGELGLLIDWRNKQALGSYRKFTPEESKQLDGIKHIIKLFIMTPDLWDKIHTMDDFIKIIHTYLDKSQTLEHEVTHMVDQIDYNYFDKTFKIYDNSEIQNKEYYKSGIENNARWNEWSTQFVYALKTKMKSKFKGYLTKGAGRFVEDAIEYFNKVQSSMMAEINKNPEKLKKLKSRIYLFHQDLIKKYL